MTDRPVRKRLAHGVKLDGDECPILFVTVCVQRREAVLANDAVHTHLTDAWRDARAWLVGRCVMMPDHLHFFTAPLERQFTLEAWVRFWKSQFSKRLARDRGQRLVRWQSDHWDTRLRSAASYAEKWEYVRNNPVRKGLVRCSEDWPWQGMLNELRWD